METTTHIPKFRTITRLLNWARRHSGGRRLPPDRENIFFKKAVQDPSGAALLIARYAYIVGPLDEGLENLLTAYPTSIMEYADNIKRFQKQLPERLYPYLEGHPHLVVRLARHTGRKVPENLEKCLTQKPEYLVDYAMIVGELNEEMCRSICTDPSLVLRYANILNNKYISLPNWMMDEMKGNNEVLFHIAYRHMKKRLPTHLEDSLDDPSVLLGYSRDVLKGKLPAHLEKHLMKDQIVAYQYAIGILRGRFSQELEDMICDPGILYEYSKSVVRGRLPLHLELRLLKDHRFACQYAFDVVRGFADIRLPDELHTMLYMKSCQNPDDPFIKKYFAETERLEKMKEQNP